MLVLRFVWHTRTMRVKKYWGGGLKIHPLKHKEKNKNKKGVTICSVRNVHEKLTKKKKYY